MAHHWGVGAGSAWTSLGAVLLALFVIRFSKTERLAAVRTIGVFVLSLLAQWLSGWLETVGMAVPAEYIGGIAVFAEGVCLISLVAAALFGAILPQLGYRAARIIQEASVGLASAVWGLIWLHMHQVNLASLLATSAVVTAVLGFALQDTLGNILGGIAIQFDQSIQVGDWLKIEEVVGKVVQIRWRHTAVETRDWETVVIPNAVLLKSKFEVLGRRHGEAVRLRRSLPFAVTFQHSPGQVIDAVEYELRNAEIPRVASDPAPYVFVNELADIGIRYVIRYWLTDLTIDNRTDSDVRMHAYYALQRAGIPLAIPSQSLYLTHENEERDQQRAAAELEERRHALRRVDLFGALQPDEISELAARLVPAPFGAGAVITRQGATANWLYLIHDGEADVLVENGTGHSAVVAQLGPGNFFGEMGLMTGEPRSATVVTRTVLMAYRLDKEAFRDVLCAREELAGDISRILGLRRAELDARLEGLDAEARELRLTTAQTDLLTRIRRFFSIEN